jgi:glutamyl-Q tRNA(Asp) synthetase
LPERTRFAPSPTGLLHLGHAYAAISAYNAARSGEFLVRIEDLDCARSREEFTAAVYEDLSWLGLCWIEPVLRQSARSAAYRDALQQLEARGLVYPCFCTRREIADEVARSSEAPHDVTAQVVYPGTCRGLTASQRTQRFAEGRGHALRLDVRQAVDLCPDLEFDEHGEGPNGERGTVRVDPTLFGDIVLARKDLAAAYHLAVVVDDAFQRISLVTRGNDLFSSTPVQRLLQYLLGLPTPRYAHHRLILDSGGKKFSKRDHAVTLRSLRSAGVSPKQICEQIGLSLTPATAR